MDAKESVRAVWPAFRSVPVEFAATPFSRARGLLGRKGFEGVLLLAPCCDVHTAGMGSPIDVAFVDGAGRVLESHRMVGPRRRLRNAAAVCVIERFSSCGAWPRAGERLAISAIAEDDERSQA